VRKVPIRRGPKHKKSEKESWTGFWELKEGIRHNLKSRPTLSRCGSSPRIHRRRSRCGIGRRVETWRKKLKRPQRFRKEERVHHRRGSDDKKKTGEKQLNLGGKVEYRGTRVQFLGEVALSGRRRSASADQGQTQTSLNNLRPVRTIITLKSIHPATASKTAW